MDPDIRKAYIAELEERVAEIREDLALFESGRVQHFERIGSDPALHDITSELISDYKATMELYERLLVALKKEERD